jgi:hypothetical protein
MLPLNLYARVRSSIPIARETAGAARTRPSLRPPFSRRAGRKDKTSRENTRRDREGVCGDLPSLHALLRVAGGVGGGGSISLLLWQRVCRGTPPTPKSELRSSRPHRFAEGGEWTKHSTLFHARRNGLLRCAHNDDSAV